ncbi:MAG: Sporulation kinase E [bacterium ADurb.Bin429]|nr:MAG: Sporulation kinase E [bacterium ADurb.Bin429]
MADQDTPSGTDDKQCLEVELRDTRKRLKELTDLINRGVAVIFRWRLEPGASPVEYVSETVRQFGYTPEDFTAGRVSWPGITHPDDVPRLEAEVADYTARGERHFHQQYRIVTAGGEIRWIDDHTVAVHDDAGNLTHYEGMLLDITTQKQTEAALSRRDEELRLIVENTLDVLYTFDVRTGEVTYISPAVTRWHISPEEIIGRSVTDFIHPDDTEIVARDLETTVTTGKSFLSRFRLIVPDGRVVPVEEFGKPIWQDGAVVRITGVLRDITERVQAEEARSAMEQQFAQLFEAAPIPIALVTIEEDRYLAVNRAFEQLAEYSRDEVIGKTSREIGIFPDEPRMRQACMQLQQYGALRDYTAPYRTKSGAVRTALFAAQFIRISGREVLLTAAQDITERVRAEDALRTSEERFRALIEHSQDAVVMLDATGRFLYASPAAARINGYPLESFPAHSAFEIIHPDDLPTLQKNFQHLLQSPRGTLATQFRLQHANGEYRWVDATAQNLLDTPAIRAVVVNYRDITERKQAEEARRAMEWQFQLLFEAVPVPVTLTSVDAGQYLAVNRAFEQVTGYSRDDIIGQSVLDLNIFVHLEQHRQALEQLHQRGTLRDFVAQFYTKNGEVRTATFAGEFLDWHGKPALLTAALDITERVAAEEALQRAYAELEERVRARTAELTASNQALRESEERFHAFAELAPVGIFVGDASGEVTYVNERWSAITGWPREQALGTKWMDGIHPDDREYVTGVREVTFRERRESQLEYRYLTPDGIRKWLSVNVRPLLDADGAITGYIGTVLDTTARKQAEDALRAQTAILQLFFDCVPAAVAMFDTEMRYLAVSQRWHDDYGLNGRDIIGHSHYDVFPEIGERWKALHQRALAGEVLHCEEDPFPRADGTLDWVRWDLVPWRQPDGRIGGIIIFTEVITERKQAEEALQESETRYRALFENAADAIVLLDLQTLRFIDCNDLACQRLGYTREEFVRLTVPEIEATETAKKVKQHITDITARGSAAFETQHRSKGGAVFDIEVRANVIHFGGRPALIAIWHDITARKQAEAERERLLHAIEQWAAEMDTTISAIADGVIIYGPDGVIVRMNAATREILEMTDAIAALSIPERIAYYAIKTATGTRVALEDYPPVRALHGETVRGMVLSVTPDGDTRRWLSVSATPILTPDGDLLGAVATFADITEQRELQQRQEDLLHIVSHDLRIPLTVILGHMELLETDLRKRELDGELALHTSTITRNAHRLNTMIHDLVDMARLEGNQFGLELAAVPLREYLPDLRMRPGDDVHGDQLAQLARRRGAGHSRRSAAGAGGLRAAGTHHPQSADECV